MQHETHRVPVTALAFWSHDVVLAGEGGLLRAYDLKTTTLLASAQIFRGQAIHGIAKKSENEEPELLVHGGHDLCIVRLTKCGPSSHELEIGAVTKADDWILHAAFCPSTLNNESNHAAAFVTAHNALVLAKFDQDLRLNLEPVVSGSNCILYCAQVTWLSASRCLIASGTAFGDVVLWSCFISQDDDTLLLSYQTHYAFPAHEGSVFGVELSSSDVAKAVGGRQHLLISCSDDRTIRIWDVSDLTRQAPQKSEQQQETGFGAKRLEGQAPPLLAKIMGHISRIWHVRFIHQPTADDVYILSFGEDAHCISWRLEASASEDTKLPYELTQWNARRLHSGKNIWSLAVADGRQVATGGADGALSWFHFADAKLSRQGHMSSPPDQANMGDSYRSYAFIGDNRLIATTDQGQLYLISLGDGDCQDSAVSECVPELRGYSIVASADGAAFVAGAKGTVYSFTLSPPDLKALLTTDGKVAGLFVSDSSSGPATAKTHHLDLLITNVGSTIALHCSVMLPSAELTRAGERQLNLPDGFVVTSFASCGSPSQTILVLGSRNGSIAVYKAHSQAEQVLSPVILYRAAHGQETVTRLVLSQQERVGTGNNLYLLSTGRDGTFAAHDIRLSDTETTLTTKHQVQLPFGPNIEGLEVHASGSIWVCGFRGKHFVAFDLTGQKDIMSVECGGVHRNWAFQRDDTGGTFVWTKASKLYFATQEHPLHYSANSGGHGREMKCIATSPVDSRLFATGAEDTDIKLNRYESGSFRCLHTLQKHVTGVQHLQWSTDGQHLFSSGGFEEFIVWRIVTDVPPHLGIGVKCESRHPKSGTSDLRITSFDIQGQQEPDGDSDSTFEITMVYSDSTIRSWQYRDRVWVLLAEGDYLTSCLTQCLPGADHGQSITASTDGFLATWLTDKAEKKLTWTRRHKVHQSAVLSTAQLDLAGEGSLIISGGDDNAIGITLVAESRPSWTLLMPRAHTAAVTALVTVSVGEDCFWFASASIDQRVKLWRVSVDTGKAGSDMIDVKLVANVFTAVADVSSMEKIRCSDGRAGLLVAGVGLDVWRLPQGEDRSG